MINIKTSEEIEIMKVGGRILAEVLTELLKNVRPGVSELEIDKLAEKLISEKGGQPAFKRVKGYKHTICVSVNDVVVHGIPGNYQFKEGDTVGIDCGVYYRGFNTDMAHTIKISNLKSQISNGGDEVDKFLKTGKRALEEAIKMARVGNRIGHISKTIQEIIEKADYSVVQNLVGHGVGRQLHEEPEVPGFVNRPILETPELEVGMTIAIEVIYNQGKPGVELDNDGWTIKSKDGSLSGLFERTVVITDDGPVVLTS